MQDRRPPPELFEHGGRLSAGSGRVLERAVGIEATYTFGMATFCLSGTISVDDHLAQLLDGPDAGAWTSVTDEAHGLVSPRSEHLVQRIFSTGGAVVVPG